MSLGVAAENVLVVPVRSREEAETCLSRLGLAASRPGMISVVARGAALADDPAEAAFWSSLRASLPGWTVLELSGLGELRIAGPLGEWIAAAQRNEAVFGGLSAPAATLYILGVSKSAVVQCETALESGAILVVVHGARCEVESARALLAAASQ